MNRTPEASTEPQPRFWSTTYGGHHIATFCHRTGWLVYLDRVMQENTLFATAEDATTWLRRTVDGGNNVPTRST
jgi:hypothetical protein